ncbi:MAG: 3'-5' exoribonuclease [Deltaproteobacteria bacterium]|nr:3'-5' exoribonuclease [Deltaproteobacteria bacterium]
MAREIYVSTDVEADGPIPGPHSMLSFASVAFDEDGGECGAFTANLTTLPGAIGHPATMVWWQTQPRAWEACRREPRPPESALPDYARWLEALPGRPVFVGYPAAFDYLFVHWYLHRFAGRSPFSHSALDIKTLAMALLGGRYRDATKQYMPRRWFPATTHSHVALDDAREQGLLFVNMRREWLARRATAPSSLTTTGGASS